MGFIKVIVIFVATLYTLLYTFWLLRILFHRMVFFVKLRFLVNKLDSLSLKVWPLAIFSWNKTVRPSFTVETTESIYVVKLCGSLIKRDIFTFESDGSWTKCSAWFRLGKKKTIEQKPVIISSDISESFKEVRLVYLFVPPALGYLIRVDGRLKPISHGENIGSGLLHSTRSFLSLLMEEERSNDLNVI